MSNKSGETSKELAAHDNSQSKNLTSGVSSEWSRSRSPAAASAGANEQQQPATVQATLVAGEKPHRASDNEEKTVDGGGSCAPRRPRPFVHRAPSAQLMRRAQLVALANQSQQQQPQQHGVVVEPQTNYGAPITAQIELAAGVLQPAGRATGMPPKRPSYLPSRADQQHAHHRFAGQQLTTSLGATALTPSSANKPNRYSWAQMQQWHAAQQLGGATGEARLFGAAHKGDAEPAAAAAPAGAQPRAGGFHYHFPSPFSSAASRVLFVPSPIVNLGEHTKSRLIKIIEALKRFSEKWFSHVLLLLFLASYACLGAYVFISFEAPTEQWEKQLIIDTRARIVRESYDQAREAPSRDHYFDTFRARFEEYERLLNRMCASGMSSSSLENQWTFWGALFYSMTVFTTIGYGHLTPVTFAGRVATMIYAIFGIPILLMVLADLGKLLTRIIKCAFRNFRYWYNKLLGRKASVRTRQLITDHSNQYIGVAKSAFERGFASYIQPYQSRIPGALRDAQLRMSSLRQRHRQQRHQMEAADGNSILLVDQDGAPPLGSQQQQGAMVESVLPTSSQMESSEVIVTPAKQTKPVSPKVAQGAGSRAHPLAAAANGQSAASCEQRKPQDQMNQENPHHQQHQQHQHHHHHHQANKQAGHERRSQSPGLQGKRKISSTTSKHQRKNSVSRSSSASNVATGSERHTRAAMAAHAAASNKRASVDQVADQLVGGLDSGANKARNSSSAEVGPDDQAQIEQQQQQQHDELSQIGSQQNDLEAEPQMVVDEFEQLDEDLDIPVSFALFLLITYMMFGAVVFSIWESWNFFDALYFVFISMSTIGFGDLVPQHPKRMIGTFAYLLFGLALTSMCINVVQEKIHATFLRAKMQIGEKMGFDLDQIMADDYYGDGNSAFGDEPDHMGGPMEHNEDEDNGSFANNSLAVSQSNSQIGAELQHVANTTGELKAASSFDQQPHSQADQHQQSAQIVASSKSRSKESLKSKKRSTSGGSAVDQQASNSMKRKIACANKKPTRQTSPASSSGPSQVASPTASSATAPIKSQLETIRLFDLPVESQLDDDDDDDTKRGSPMGLTPCINQPIVEGIRSFCEPLRRALRAVQASGTTSKPPTEGAAAPVQTSAPMSTSLQANSCVQPSQSGAQQSAARSALPASKSFDSSAALKFNNTLAHPNELQKWKEVNSLKTNTLRGGNSPQHQRHLHHSERHRSPTKPISRSLNSSRRASVSHELSQLDDLIVALSCSPPERFGPLLGIPATAGGRSNHRSVSPNSSSGNNNNNNNNNNKNSTSPSSNHILRPQSQQSGDALSQRHGAATVVAAAAAARPTLLGDQKSRPLVQSPSQQLLSNHLNARLNDSQGFAESRRKQASPLSSTTSSRSRVEQEQEELNLSESQAALDELEAVKYSAV